MTKYRLALLTVFVVCLLAQLAAFVVTYLNGEIYADEVTNLIKELLMVYSVPMTIMVAGIAASRRPRKDVSQIFWIALSLVILWNLLFAWRSLAFSFAGVSGDSDTKLIAYFKEISYGSFIIAGVLTYFFNKGN